MGDGIIRAVEDPDQGSRMIVALKSRLGDGVADIERVLANDDKVIATKLIG